MQLKHILCTLFALGIVGTAHAADDIITGGDGTCNETVLGTSENMAQVDTIATWLLNDYDCPAGQYLNVDGDTVACTPCASGSYCPGGIFTVESENKGTNICPTGYTSDEGTKSESACYTQCELSCFQTACPQNASGACVYGDASVPGQEFYGFTGVCMTEGARFCSIDFSCKSGYTKQTTTWTEMRQQLGQLEYTDGMRYCDGVSGSSFRHDCSAVDKNEIMIKSFDPETKTFYVESIEAVHFDVSSLIGYVTELGLQVSDMGFIMVPSELDLESTRYYNAYALRPYRIAKITEQELLEYANKHNMTFDAVIDGINNDTVDIRSMTAKLPDNLPWVVVPDTDIDWQSGETYDALDNTNLNGLGMMVMALIVMVDVPGSGYPDMASMVYGDIPYSSCVVNKINIDWNPDDGSENITGMCLYGGDVNVPNYVPTKPGYTFKGWKLVTE